MLFHFFGHCMVISQLHILCSACLDSLLFFFCLLLEFNQVCNVLIVGLALVPQCLGQTQRHLRSQRI